MKRGKNPRCPAVIYSNDGNSSVSVDSKAQLYVKKNIIPTCEAKNEEQRTKNEVVYICILITVHLLGNPYLNTIHNYDKTHWKLRKAIRCIYIWNTCKNWNFSKSFIFIFSWFCLSLSTFFSSCVFFFNINFVNILDLITIKHTWKNNCLYPVYPF